MTNRNDQFALSSAVVAAVPVMPVLPDVTVEQDTPVEQMPPVPAVFDVESLPLPVLGLLALRGQIVGMMTERPLKVRKGKSPITKASSFRCRIGCNYDNLASVQEKRENGELPAENAGLPWGSWLLFPYVIGHKGCHYFRCTTLKNSNVIPTVRYLRNGVEITKDEAKADALASEFYDKDNDVFTVKVESIRSLSVKGKHVAWTPADYASD